MNQNIKDYIVGTGKEDLTFLQRLERENGWNSKFSQKAFNEYKKFIYLCSISEDSLTPSDQVDQVWHLHLTYTQDYWNHFCKDVIKKEIHHNPTQGGDEQRNKFTNDYEATLNFYKKIFRSTPPKEVWPSSKIRFKKDVNGVRVHRSKYVVVSKNFFILKNLTIILSIVGLFFEFHIFFFSGLCLMIFGIFQWFFTPSKINITPKKMRKDGGCGCDTGCSGCGDGCGGCGD